MSSHATSDQPGTLTLEQQIRLCQQVARLVGARLPLSSELLRTSGASDSRSQATITTLQQQLEGGKPLAAALAGDESRNSRILRACIEAGERSGALSELLEAWTTMHLDNATSARRIRNAMLYPSLLIVVTLLALGYVIWSLIPEYRATFMQFNQTMPMWLDWIVWVRMQFWGVILLLIVLMLSPLVYWSLRNRRVDAHGVSRNPVQRLRGQGLAAEAAAWMLRAQRPLSEITDICSRIMGTDARRGEQAFSEIVARRSPPQFPRQLSLMFSSLHGGLVQPEDASKHLWELSEAMRSYADDRATRNARWLPMLVAAVVGGVTIVTYLLLIYLPWITLLRRIVSTEAGW